MGKRRPVVLISSGEESGDLHASILVRELLDRIPGAEIIALGGDRMAGAGAELLFHYRDYAVLGFSDVIRSLPRFIRLETALKNALDGGVDLFIPVDYPGLNLRLARHAKRRGIPVLYYISPQVWAWGGGRMKKIKRSVDCMAVILPFEERLYEGMRVEFVGHPFVENDLLPRVLSQDERRGVGLLPGSRPEEVRRILPVLLEASREVAARTNEREFSVGMAPSVPRSLYRESVAGIVPPVSLEEDSVSLMRRSKLVLVASGTATLQAALLETPMVIVYRVSTLNYLLARRLVRIRNIGLVNIILGEEVCPEFVQERADPRAIGRRAARYLLDEHEREEMLAKLASLRSLLAGNGGAARVAGIAEELMDARENHGGSGWRSS